jgi:hypothetical protein
MLKRVGTNCLTNTALLALLDVRGWVNLRSVGFELLTIEPGSTRVERPTPIACDFSTGRLTALSSAIRSLPCKDQDTLEYDGMACVTCVRPNPVSCRTKDLLLLRARPKFIPAGIKAVRTQGRPILQLFLYKSSFYLRDVRNILPQPPVSSVSLRSPRTLTRNARLCAPHRMTPRCCSWSTTIAG